VVDPAAQLRRQTTRAWQDYCRDNPHPEEGGLVRHLRENPEAWARYRAWRNATLAAAGSQQSLPEDVEEFLGAQTDQWLATNSAGGANSIQARRAARKREKAGSGGSTPEGGRRDPPPPPGGAEGPMMVG